MDSFVPKFPSKPFVTEMTDSDMSFILKKSEAALVEFHQ